MSGILTDALVIVLLLVVNGVLAMSELAIVTARRVRLEQRAEDGDAGARAALALANEPTRFLSTVQVGITLIGVLAGAFGGATIAKRLAEVLAGVPAIEPYANGLALGLVVTAITYLSLVVGELVPKRVALSNPERIAAIVARPMQVLARIASPVVVLLTGPTNLVLRVFGIRVRAEPSLTVEEIRALIEQGAESGVLEKGEHEIVESVFRFGDRLVADVMTPRANLDCLDANDTAEIWTAHVVERPSSRYFVCDGDIDHILGVVFAEDLLAQVVAGQTLDLRAVLRDSVYVPGTLPALSLFEQMRTSNCQAAVAIDEHGGVEGAVLLDTLIDAAVGEHPSGAGSFGDRFAESGSRTVVLPGSTPLEDVETEADLPEIPAEVRRGVRTLGGLIMNLLERVPRDGDTVEWKGFHFEVARMHGRSVSRVIVRKPPSRAAPDRRPDQKASH